MVLCEVRRNKIDRHVTCPFKSAPDSLRDNISGMQLFLGILLCTEDYVSCDILQICSGVCAQFWDPHILQGAYLVYSLARLVATSSGISTDIHHVLRTHPMSILSVMSVM